MASSTFTTMPPQVEPAVESTEQLLRSLDLELTRRRGQRELSEGRRAAVLIGGLLLVVAVGAAALMFAFSMLNDLRDRPPEAEPAAAVHG